MNPSIEALLELQVIDRQRQKLLQARLKRQQKLDEGHKTAAKADEIVAGFASEADRLGALVRQYTSDLARCDAAIAELRAKQMNAKTNKEYMAIINGIETARVEKGHREASLKDLDGKLKALEERTTKAREQATQVKAKIAEYQARKGGGEEASPEEQALQTQYDARKAAVDPKFLEIYERLVQAHHPRPLMRVDPASGATLDGVRISMNQIEQIRMGKLVICAGINSILYVDERDVPAAKTADG